MEQNNQASDYITYVQEQIEQFKKYTNLIDDALGEITPAQVNYALANYTNVNIALNTEYQRKKSELDREKRAFQVWWDEQFVVVRREMNPPTNPGTKWLSKQELESEVRSRNKTTYLQYRDKLDEIENQVSFLQRLLSQWADHGRMLTTLSQNMRQEMVSLGIQDRVDKTTPHRRHEFDATYVGENGNNGGNKTRRRKVTNTTGG